jgi:hypothetical protein
MMPYLLEDVGQTMDDKSILTEKVQELEIAMKNSTGVEAMQMAGVLTATKKKLAGTTTGININPARLSPQDRKVESLRMKEHWHGCTSIDDL